MLDSLRALNYDTHMHIIMPYILRTLPFDDLLVVWTSFKINLNDLFGFPL